MGSAVAIWIALALAFVAARVTLRRRAVFLLGAQGHRVAPSLLASLWLVGVLLGQMTHSLVGMTWAGTLVLMVVAAVARRRFAPLRGRHRTITPIDGVIVCFIGALFLCLDIWDIECRRAIVGQYLHGNLPPTAINDPHAPLAYHAVYDGLVAIVLKAFPLDLGLGMAVVSTSCVALTIANLGAIGRALFRSGAAAQLGRVLFAFGYGPVFLRCFGAGFQIDPLHGKTSEVYVDIIFRRPAALGFAFFTLALALVLPAFRSDTKLPQPGPRRRWRSLVALTFLIPTCALIPLLAEETILFTGVLLLPLVVVPPRLPWWLVAAMAGAALIGASQSGVVHGVLGHVSMATPHPRLAWPPTLPQGQFTETGVPLFSWYGFLFFAVELGPVFALAAIAAVVTPNPRWRILAALFGSGLLVAIFVRTLGWPKSDLDRFLFYGTPFLFMLSASIIDRARDRWAGSVHCRRKVNALAIGLAVAVCTAPVIYPSVLAARQLRNSFDNHPFGGDLKRDLRIVGAREPILSTVERSDELIQAGFMVVAPLETNSVGQVTKDRFDDYVSVHARDAVWLFLPSNDARLAGRDVMAKHGDFCLARARR